MHSRRSAVLVTHQVQRKQALCARLSKIVIHSSRYRILSCMHVQNLKHTSALRPENDEYLFADDTTEGKTNAGYSIRRKSARLFEKRAASLLSCRTGRPAAFGRRRRTARLKRKRKPICWLYKGTPCMGSSKVHDRSRGSCSQSEGTRIFLQNDEYCREFGQGAPVVLYDL